MTPLLRAVLPQAYSSSTTRSTGPWSWRCCPCGTTHSTAAATTGRVQQTATTRRVQLVGSRTARAAARCRLQVGSWSLGLQVLGMGLADELADVQPCYTQLFVAFIFAHCMLFFIAAAESDYSEQSDQDTEGRRRPQRPRRAARQAAEEYLHELAGDAAAAAPAVGAAPAAAGGQSLDAGAYESDGGKIEGGPGPAGGCVWPFEWLVLRMLVCPSTVLLTSLCTPTTCPPAGSELSSVQLLDEASAERQRVALIERLVKEALTADFEGGCCCLTVIVQRALLVLGLCRLVQHDKCCGALALSCS